MTEEQQLRVTDMQHELHAYSKKIMELRPHITYEDAKLVYLLMKIAELQSEIQSLKTQSPSPIKDSE